MKKVLILCVAAALYATSAFAAGADLTALACPGNAGAADNIAAFDCTAGDVLSFMGCFQPAEAIPDLVGIDVIIDLAVSGDMSGNASFWDFGGANSAGLGLTHTRPSSGCTGYTATFSLTGSAEGIAFRQQSPSNTRMGIVVARPSTGPLSVQANQKLFGFNMTFDTSTSAEGGNGTGAGCGSVPATLVLQQITPGSLQGIQTTVLQTGASATNCVVMGAAGTAGSPTCGAVPVQRHTWGALKSLYR
jgi:hypothetical protein